METIKNISDSSLDKIPNQEKIDNLLSKLEEKTTPVFFEKLWFLIWDLDKEKTNEFLNILNNNLSEDKWIQKKWDFYTTLNNLKVA